MLRHHLTTALRSILRKKSYSIVSIIGLATGMACCLLILVFVTDELSYDQYHVKKDRIYRFATHVQGASYEGIAKINGPWGPAIQAEVPEIEEMTRFVSAGQMVMSHGEQRIYETGGFYADSSVFKIFSFPFIQGNPTTALTEPASVVLTTKLAEKYFGSQNALSQTISIDNEEYKVTGILDNLPSNSHFTFTYLLSMSSLKHPDKDSWTNWNQFYTYLLLREGSSPESVALKAKDVLRKHLDANHATTFTPLLQPLTSIHLHSNLFREMEPNSDVTYLYIFSSIGLLILAISWANFINLATAQASARGKEICVRKVNGAHRVQLTVQFLAEIFIICLVALAIAQLLTWAALPALNQLTGKALQFSLFSRLPALAGMVGILLVTAVLVGGYPALYLSALRPVQILRGRWSPSGGQMIRRGLAIFQFALSSVLVVASATVLQQLNYMQHKPLGFDPDQIINIPIQDNFLRKNYLIVKKELLSNPAIRTVSLSGNLPGGSDWGIPILAEGTNPDQAPPLRIMAVDPDFIATYGMEITQGRSFSADVASDSLTYLINEEAARLLNWNNPLTKTMSMPAVGRPTGQVIGTVKDFHFRSMHEKIGGLVFIMPPSNWYSLYSIKIEASQMKDALKYIEQKWDQFDPQHPFTYTFFDESYNKLYQREQLLAQLVSIFTGVGIFLACLGLFSFASFTTALRTKEIGIRKVIGASSYQIVTMLSRQYILIVVVGFTLALPLSLYLLNQWLETFAYRVELSPLLLIVSCLLTLMVALITVGYRALRVAFSNPVSALRAE